MMAMPVINGVTYYVHVLGDEASDDPYRAVRFKDPRLGPEATRLLPSWAVETERQGTMMMQDRAVIPIGPVVEELDLIEAGVAEIREWMRSGS